MKKLLVALLLFPLAAFAATLPDAPTGWITLGIAAGAVLCGELSLLAALTNPGELMDAHIRIERT